MIIGSIEAGGTKFVCAIGNEQLKIIDKITFKTTLPNETLNKVINYFKKFKGLSAISIGTFGPIDIDKSSKTYGYIKNTPKRGWSNINFLGIIKRSLNIPIFWTTDVNSSAYGEFITSNKKNIIYFTVGTGIGAGIIMNGRFINEKYHPEIGHIKIKRHPEDLSFNGICPYHKDCLEGLCSGPTFEARLGKKGSEVELTNKVWDIMAYYMAQAIMETTLFLRPDKIILGGSVINSIFIDKVKIEFNRLINGYISIGNINNFITKSKFKENESATIGNFALASKIFKRNKNKINIKEIEI